MKNKFRLLTRLKNQKGVTAVLVGLLMVVFLGLAALAIDLGHLFGVSNELQNAADAGALAGARVLYNDDGTAINSDANQIAYDIATQNKSEKIPVEVNWSPGQNTGSDAERGHWSYAAHTFTPNDSLLPVDLWNKSNLELDQDPSFINAVRVRTRRESTPAVSFFARILGYENFSLSTEAVAYIGFAGTLRPSEGEQPIAICKHMLLDQGSRYYCRARMINSGQGAGGSTTSQTGGWSNFEQGDTACSGAANASNVKPLVCGGGNPVQLSLGDPMTTQGGEIQVAFDKLIDCWKAKTDNNADGIPDIPWTLRLPVIDCLDENGIPRNPGPCNRLVGAVEVTVLWITGSGDQASNDYKNAPRHMSDWTCTEGKTNEECWNDFTEHFVIKDDNGTAFPYVQKTIYFKPDCQYHEPAGRTGGENFGILAKIPVLVK